MTIEKCPYCKETGKDPNTSMFSGYVPCPVCDGHGERIIDVPHDQLKTCPFCSGTGKDPNTSMFSGYKPCPTCKGWGQVARFVPDAKPAEKNASIVGLVKILESATEEEKEYLNEALGCAKYDFNRASMVLVWSAAIHRMQKVVEKLGFSEFNKKSEEMKSIREGRFKRFQKSFNVNSLSELRATVFDTDLLWVLEYWELIDANQHERLSNCFAMRNNAAHPGEAKITGINLASVFSDLKNIVFDNPKFKL